jgi:hypothetical protein
MGLRYSKLRQTKNAPTGVTEDDEMNFKINKTKSKSSQLEAGRLKQLSNVNIEIKA